MIGFKINNTWLDLDTDLKVDIEIYNPLFNQEFEKGMLTYDFAVPLSRNNQQLLGFAGHLSQRKYNAAAIPCQVWMHGNLWRVGNLFVLERSNKFKVNFQSDAGVLDTLATDKLREIDLGTVTHTDTIKQLYPADVYAMPSVKNPKFHKTPPAYYDYGYMNFGAVGRVLNTVVPMPYLVHVLKKLMVHYGYTVSGDWLTEPENSRRVIFNTVLADLDAGTVSMHHHVPDITVGEFLKSIRKRYGLAFVWNTKTKDMQVVRLKDALNDTAFTDWTDIAHKPYAWAPNTTDGFELREQRDGSDELYKELPENYVSYVYGNGRDVIETGIGTTLMEAGLPSVNMQGGSIAEPSKFSFRVLRYIGQEVNDNYNTSEAELLPDLAAEHDAWLAFRSETEAIERVINLNVPELTALNPLRKTLITGREGTAKAFWESIKFSMGTKGIGPAKVKLLKVMV